MVFYIPDINGSKYALNEEESTHIVRVLRLKTGDAITLTDGRGNLYRAVIVDANHKRCITELVKHLPEYGKRPYRLHIGIAPTKSIDRFEWFVEKATEIGVDEITPLLCARSERKQIKAERMRRVMIAAMKQSQKAYLPQVNEMTAFDKWLKTQTAGCRYIAHCNEGERQLLKTAYQPEQDATIAIGPEGDFSSQEVMQAIDCGFQEISLGTSLLRTETAGIIACHSVNFINSNLKNLKNLTEI